MRERESCGFDLHYKNNQVSSNVRVSVPGGFDLFLTV